MTFESVGYELKGDVPTQFPRAGAKKMSWLEAELLVVHKSWVASPIGEAQANIHFLKRKLSSAPAESREVVQIDPAVMHGNPVISGTRIPLYRIVEELADSSAIPEVVEGYPSLSEDQLRASLDYVASLLRVHDD
jgi:uncharacterized protein (DUF433 family)